MSVFFGFSEASGSSSASSGSTASVSSCSTAPTSISSLSHETASSKEEKLVSKSNKGNPGKRGPYKRNDCHRDGSIKKRRKIHRDKDRASRTWDYRYYQHLTAGAEATSSNSGFSSRSDLDQHCQDVHSHNLKVEHNESSLCPVCGRRFKSFKGKDSLTDHLKNIHGVEDPTDAEVSKAFIEGPLSKQASFAPLGRWDNVVCDNVNYNGIFEESINFLPPDQPFNQPWDNPPSGQPLSQLWHAPLLDQPSSQLWNIPPPSQIPNQSWMNYQGINEKWPKDEQLKDHLPAGVEGSAGFKTHSLQGEIGRYDNAKSFVSKYTAGLACPICLYEEPSPALFLLKTELVAHILEKHSLQEFTVNHQACEPQDLGASSAVEAQGYIGPAFVDFDLEKSLDENFGSMGTGLPTASKPSSNFDSANTIVTKMAHAADHDASQKSEEEHSECSPPIEVTASPEYIASKTTKAEEEGSPSSACSSFVPSSTSRCSQNDHSSISSFLTETSTPSPFERNLDTNTRTFIESLAKQIASHCVDLFRKQFTSHHGGDSETCGHINQSIQSSPGSSQKPTKKRSCQRDEDDGDQNNGSNNGPPSKKKDTGDTKKARYWACPYTKFDSVRYSEHNQQGEKKYRKCPSAMLINITRLKKHLERTHLEPKEYCGNCYRIFKTKRERLQHDKDRRDQAEICRGSDPMYQEMMTEEQFSLIGSNNLSNTSSSWYWIFGVLFPNTPLPPSPHVTISDTSQIQTFIGLFRVIGPVDFLAALSTGLARDSQSLQLNASLDTLIEETFEAAFPEYLNLLHAITSGTITQNGISASTLTEEQSAGPANGNATSTGPEESGDLAAGPSSYPEPGDTMNLMFDPLNTHQRFEMFLNNRLDELDVLDETNL